MSPNQQKATIFFAANGLIMTIFAIVGALLYVYGPCIEPYVAGYPVAIPQPDMIWRGYIIKRETKREVEVVCFRLRGLRKLAAAISPRYSFQVQTQLSDAMPVAAYVADQHCQSTGEEPLPAHPVGAKWDRWYAFEMPGTIGDEQIIRRVLGRAEHVRLIFGKPVFWKSETPVPDFAVKQVACYLPDGVGTESDRCR